MTVFFLCGLWHGASWTFVVWGLYHGLFLVLERVGIGKFLVSRNRVAAHAYTLLVVVVGWVLFRAETFSHATAFLGAMAGLSSSPGPYCVAHLLSRDIQISLLAGAVLATPVFPRLARFREQLGGSQAGGWKAATNLAVQGVRVAGLAAILAVSAMWLAAGTHNPFIYFRF